MLNSLLKFSPITLKWIGITFETTNRLLGRGIMSELKGRINYLSFLRLLL